MASGRIDRYLSEIHSAGLGATTIAQLAIVTATLCYAVGPSLTVISLVTHRSFLRHRRPAVDVIFVLAIDRRTRVPWDILDGRRTGGVFRLLTTLGSIGTASSSYLRAVVSVILGTVFLGERLAPQSWVGLALVLIGVAAISMPARRAKRSTERSQVRPPLTICHTGFDRRSQRAARTGKAG
jgi:hypothetical protein